MTRLLALTLALAMPNGVAAHALSNSYLSLELSDHHVAKQRIEGRWRVALRDLDSVIGLDRNADRQITDQEVHQQASGISEYLLTRLELSTGQRACTTKARDHEVGSQHLTIAFEALCPSRPRALTIRYDLFLDHDPNHQGLLQLTDGEQTRAAVFTASERILSLDLAVDDLLGPIADYLVQGVWHIWIGYDHILFLLTLLLPAVLRRRDETLEPIEPLRDALVSVVKIVTAFTLAHSLTLALAALGIVEPPGRWVEVAIAGSVVLAALNNIYPVVTHHSWVLALGFGLIHGFGFAGVLQELGLPRGLLALALLSFNVGVELGQLAIVAAVVPLLYWMRKLRLYPRLVLAGGSLAIALLGSVWIVERTAEAPIDQLTIRLLDPDSARQADRALADGERHLRAGKMREAREAFGRARARFAERGDDAAVARVAGRLGDIALARADVATARAMYRASLRAAEEAGDRAATARAYRDLARSAQLAGRLPEAARLQRLALERQELLDDESQTAGDCILLGTMYRQNDNWSGAVTMYQRAIDILERLGDSRALAVAYGKLGVVLQLRDQPARAEIAHRRALAIDQTLGRTRRVANHHANLGNVLRRRGQRARAREHYLQSVQLFRRVGSSERAARVDALLASLARPVPGAPQR